MLKWRALSQRFVDNSFGQWRRRLQCVVNQHGGHIEIMFHIVCTIEPLLLQTTYVEVFSGVQHGFLCKFRLSVCVTRADRHGAL